MLKETVQDALNDQLNAELYSGYLYLSMSAYFKSKNLDGFASWMYVQAQEELLHAMKFYQFVNRRGGTVVLKGVESPPNQWASPLTAFEDALKHEQYITDRINKLVDLAINERDHATNAFLQWFVDEQVEEEENVGGVLEQLKMVDDSKGALFLIDRELSGRTAPPADTAVEE